MLPDIEEVDSKWKKLSDSCLERVLARNAWWSGQTQGVGSGIFLKEAYFERHLYSGYKCQQFKYLVESNEKAVRIPKAL